MKRFVVTAILITFVYMSGLNVRADGILLSWSTRDVPGVTEQAYNEARQLSAEGILKKNRSVATWADAFLVMVAANARKDDKQLLSGLASQITDMSSTKLGGTSRLIIWERVSSGDLLFEGKGYQVDDDIFTISGRANWILRNLTKKNFGYVDMASSKDEVSGLQKKWLAFLSGEPVEEYKNPYFTTEKGLSEIRSLSALEALIASLKSSDEKSRLTTDCLKRIYKMDKLPSEGPALMCSPDTMTHSYLKILSGVEDKHDHAWWKSWLDTNRAKFVWNSEKGRFDVGK